MNVGVVGSVITEMSYCFSLVHCCQFFRIRNQFTIGINSHPTMSIISYRQNVFISKGSLGIGQLSSIQYFRTIAVSKEDAQVKILPTESIVDGYGG